MEVPLQITFRGMAPSPAVRARIRDKAKSLERFHPHIIGCRVVVEVHHRHLHKGRLYHVRIALTVPGAELVVSREPAEHPAHEDVYVTIRDAFSEAIRQLELTRSATIDRRAHSTPASRW